MSYWVDGGEFPSPEAAETVARRNGVDPSDFQIKPSGENKWRLSLRANQDKSDDDAFQGRRGF